MEKKELIKTHWLALTSGSNHPQGHINTSRNPEVQVTNIEFNQ